MSANITLIPFTNHAKIFHLFTPIKNSTNLYTNPSKRPTEMWRIVLNQASKQASSKNLRFLKDPFPLTYNFLEKSQSKVPNTLKKRLLPGFCQTGQFSSREEDNLGREILGFSRYQSNSNGFLLNPARSFASVAEAEVESTSSSEDVSVIEEMQGLLEEISKGSKLDLKKQQQKFFRGMGHGQYFALRKRQIKVETEAWELAAKEYKELLTDMCEQKLAPNLPYMKSLFLGWFEPLKDSITAQQELCREGKHKPAYAPFFDQLPAEMMAVITMHKLMGLLMTDGEHGSARVVPAACQIGEAIEQEIRIHRFLEKTRKKTDKDKKDEGGEPEAVTKEQDFLRKKVTDLMKKQKHHQLKKIVSRHDSSKPWGQESRAKVGSRLIDLLIQTAYVQPPISSHPDGPPDIRPAFRHLLKNVTREQKATRCYGVIECDPLIRQGLDRTAAIHVIASLLGAEAYELKTPTPILWQEHIHNSVSGVQETPKNKRPLLDVWRSLELLVSNLGFIKSTFYARNSLDSCSCLSDIYNANLFAFCLTI